MTNEELLEKACEKCESYGKGYTCEDTNVCPVYALYKRAEGKIKIVYRKDKWTIPPPPKPEMI